MPGLPGGDRDALVQEDTLAHVFRNERALFFTGAVVDLDALVTPAAAAARFLAILDRVIDDLRRGDQFSEHGRRWAEAELSELRQRIAERARSGRMPRASAAPAGSRGMLAGHVRPHPRALHR